MQTVLMFLVVLLGTLAVPVVTGAIYQAIGTRRARRRFPPPGRLVRVNEGRMHIYVTGEGAPAVVLRVGHGRVVLELDARAAACGSVRSRGELRPRRTRL